MMRLNSIRRVIWALDAFEESDGLQEKVVDTLARLSTEDGPKVMPVYVLSPDQLDLQLEFSGPWVERYRPAAQKAIAGRVKGLTEGKKIPGLIEPIVLIHQKPSHRGAIRALIDFAKTSEADLIVVGTHGRKGLSRAFLGSFAESLMLSSNIPVLVVGRESRVEPLSSQKPKILFPTDFGPVSQVVYRSVARLARDLGGEVTVLNLVSRPMEPVLQSGVYLLGGGWVAVPAFMEDEQVRREQFGRKWLAQFDGAPGSTLVIERSIDGIASSINEYARRVDASLIAMSTESGPVANALIGSITRQVVRFAPCPVWIVRTKAEV